MERNYWAQAERFSSKRKKETSSGIIGEERTVRVNEE